LTGIKVNLEENPSELICLQFREKVLAGGGLIPVCVDPLVRAS
jgi:hypothetical protein